MKFNCYKVTFIGLVFSLLYFSQVYGQSNGLPNILPPDIASLGKFGSFPVSFYNGQPNISIPLYTLNDNGVKVDISLQYDASGFMPDKEPGNVGLNWSLDGGGIVTRVVNWAPDDRNRPDMAGQYTIPVDKGFIYGLNSQLPKKDKEAVRNLSLLSISAQGLASFDAKYEYCPDVFSFSFGNYKGQFFMGNDGEVKVACDHKVKVDVSQMSGQTSLCLLNDNSYISITTDEGDTYVFGGGLEALDINYGYQDPNTGRNIKCIDGSINAWHLTTIKTHDGRVINFQYESQSSYDLQRGETHGFPNTMDYVYEKVSMADQINLYQGHSGSSSSSTVGQLFRSGVKRTYLSKIISSNGTIDFLYTKRTHSFYGTNAYVKNPTYTKRLTGLKVTNINNDTINRISLGYQEYGSSGNGYRDFLSNVSFYNNIDTFSYAFSYYRTSELPNPLTKGIDLWGYYNGKNGNTSLIPEISSGAPNYEINWGAAGFYRLAVGSYCNIGMLHKIIFPTKGTSELIYEPHSYSKILRRTVAGGMTPVLVSETGFVGGARIKEITESSGVTHHYKYISNFKNNPVSDTSSSGIATDPGVYYLDLLFYFNGSGDDHYVRVSSNNMQSSTYGEPGIGYSEIEEITGDGASGYTKYYYSNPLTNPDKYNLGNDSYKFTPNPDNSHSNFIQQIKRLVWPSSTALERGKLLKTSFYDKNGSLVKEMTNKYNQDPLRYNKSVIGFTFPIAFPDNDAIYQIFNSFALYYFNTQVTEQVVTDYAPGNRIIRNQTNYDYNDYNLISRQRDSSSKKHIKIVNYKYPFDINADPTYTEMTSRNLISMPIETRDSLDSKWLSTSQSHYSAFNSLYKLASVQNQISGGQIDTTLKILAYDSIGNPLESVDKNKRFTSYKWGYNGQYVVMKVTNATMHPEVSTVQEYSQAFNISTQDNTPFETAGGDFTVQLQTNVGYIYKMQYSLSGPQSHIGILCASGTNTACTSPQSVTFSNLPAGTYTFSVSDYEPNATPNRTAYITYNRKVIQTPAFSDFFYEGFEETGNASSSPFAGLKYHTGSYTIPYSNPNAGNFVVDYRSLEGGVWKFKTAVFSNNMTLSGTAIDEVRVYPKNGSITTYTYKPLVGVTSETPTSGNTIFYEYDDFGRLQLLRNEKGEIIKSYNYKYADQ